MTPISARFRVGLALKALLLLAFAALFAGLAVSAYTRWHWHLLARLSGAGFLVVAAGSVALAGLRGMADAVLGQALTAAGARPLKSRRSGYSLRLPSGRFVEYLLYNPWPTLEAGVTYTVTYGKYSGVLVARPAPEVS